ncbi:MAG: hypothetical protein H8E31_14830 [Planctomycetes bacterium]|nr:hypothetical protein [Planctomycetota bacterium]
MVPTALLLVSLCAPQGGYTLHPGDLVIADSSYNANIQDGAIRIYRANGAVNTVAHGSPLDSPTDVIVDRDGAILFSNYRSQWAPDNGIYRVDPGTGAVTQVDDPNTILDDLFQFCRDTRGDLIVADGYQGLARVDEAGMIHWFSPPSAGFDVSIGIALDYDGSFISSEAPNYFSGSSSPGWIWSVDHLGVRTPIGSDPNLLPNPNGLALDADGTILATDYRDDPVPANERHGLVRVDRGGQMTRLEWTGLSDPTDVEVVGAGYNLICDAGDQTIFLDPAGPGIRSLVSEHDDGNPSNGLPIDRPFGIALVPWLWLTTPMTVAIHQPAAVTVRTLPAFAGADLVLAISKDQAATPMAGWWSGDPQTSHVDLGRAVLVRQQIPANGVVNLRARVPNDPGLVGRELHLQAFLPSRRLLSNYVALPVR